ncbi:methionine--tRNA ligase [Candidatus Micrarchaeota archaeon]|nr:methionine--tRNA ligase [Candidatus Micrarchaeota archaeon]
METYYITTAIPYVNAAPHIGHALEFVQTDVVARYQRLRNKDVALVTGADENSLKNVHAAEKQGITPIELCDRNSAIFKKMANDIGLSFTSFRRTSDKEKHWPGPQKLWKLCNEGGDIYRKKYRGLYCVGCESFYEKEELSNGLCPEHNKEPEEIEEENYFFRLSRYQEKLEELIETDQLKILPETRKNEVLAFIRGGLKDFSISRSVTRAKDWGVPVPGDDSQIQYVWVDALSTYLTGIGYGTDDELFNKYWPADVHVIGKGILRFHAVYWPAILLSGGVKLPKTIFVHGYITVEGQKMSKSLGNIVDPFFLIEKYGVDPVRYCLLSEIHTFQDGDFSEKSLIEKNNNELIANLGNLVNRTLVFIKNNFDGKIPQIKELTEEDLIFAERQKELVAKIEEQLEKLEIRDGINLIVGRYAKNANRYFQDNKPWELVKTDKERAGTVMGILTNQVKNLGIMIEPYLPGTGNRIFQQLNLDVSEKAWSEIGKSMLAGHEIGMPKPLFAKIEHHKEAGVSVKEHAKFSDLDLEIGEILSVENHPDAEKLFIEKVRMGDGERQIVSGLVGHYFPENLAGKKVVIVKNLKPARLRGVESQGMLLAAEGREKAPTGEMEKDVVEVIFPEKSNVGDKVQLKGEKSMPKNMVTIEDFGKLRITVENFMVTCEGKELATESEELSTRNVKTGVVK